VLAAVAHTLDQQVLPVGRRQQRPRLVVQSGREASRVAEHDPPAHGGHQVQQRLAQHLFGQHHAGAVLAGQRLAVGQRQVGRPEHDEVGIERHRVALAEGQGPGGRAPVVAQPAGQSPGRGVGVAAVGAHALQLVDHVAQPGVQPGGHGVDRVRQRRPLLGVGRAAGQERQEAECDRRPLVAGEAAHRVEPDVGPRLDPHHLHLARQGLGEAHVLPALGAVDRDHLPAPGHGVPAQALEEERLARPQPAHGGQRRARVGLGPEGGVEQHRRGVAAVERHAEQQAARIADVRAAERAAGRQVAGQHELGVVTAHGGRRGAGHHRPQQRRLTAGRPGQPVFVGLEHAGERPGPVLQLGQGGGGQREQDRGLQLGLRRVRAQLGPLLVDCLDRLGQLGRGAGQLAVVLVDLAHQVAVLAPNLGLGIGILDRLRADAPVHREAGVVGVVQPLAATAGEPEVVGHVGQRQHGLVGRPARGVDADVTAVAGPVVVLGAAALLHDRVGEVGQHPPGPPALGLDRRAAAPAAGRLGRLPPVVEAGLVDVPAQGPGVQPAQLAGGHRPHADVLGQAQLQLPGLAAALLQLGGGHGLGRQAERAADIGLGVAQDVQPGTAGVGQGRSHVEQAAPQRHLLEPVSAGVAHRPPGRLAVEVDALGHPPYDVEGIELLAHGEQHRLRRQVHQQAADAAVHGELVGDRGVGMGERLHAPHRPHAAVGRPDQVADHGPGRGFHRTYLPPST
jgi:hypothetical protein